jgi:hypothetical protein
VKKLENKEWNFVIGDGVLATDDNLFFGPLEPGEEVVRLLPDVTFDTILMAAGVFPSKTAARKNGWNANQEATFRWLDRKQIDVVDEPGLLIPIGFTDFRAGKGKLIRITILKIT